jgi:hypothetical protein
MPVRVQRRRKPCRQRDVADSPALRPRNVAMPVRASDRELALRQIHIAPPKREDLAAPQTRITGEQHDHHCKRAFVSCGLDEPRVLLEVVKGG